MCLLNKFIDSLHVNFYVAAMKEIILPFEVNHRIEKANVIMLKEQGTVEYCRERKPVPDNGAYFIPAGQPIYARHGVNPSINLYDKGFETEEDKNKFFRTVSADEDRSKIAEMNFYLVFDVLLYNAIPFFELMELPITYVPPDAEFAHLVKYVALEHSQNKLGRDKIINNYMDEIVIHFCRYLQSQPQYAQNINKLEYLTDKRLVDIVKYIQANLSKDLSNKVISSVAYVSEDYVGQFFKSLTGKNLQDYIENQRLEKAMFLLKTEPDNVQEIAHKVGFKDPAYFSRRFKMKYGVNANSVRNHVVQLV
ncbi:MAG: AraC family transcriptional regulator [Bacteroidetes bacterium]|nr:MAG: AraC family transcriptional regulator [Bacteroidota bacterium]REK00366.1 MAG: AraC family transcriptional regulator [Bacteroidota bacterium]REK35485.1 MAG: AraC family transcriptional regulator [Bacteroidota bacterium]REK46831.1 MAG: AraC family transcriptional regulator [Bacteroidota bacterium]